MEAWPDCSVWWRFCFSFGWCISSERLFDSFQLDHIAVPVDLQIVASKYYHILHMTNESIYISSVRSLNSLAKQHDSIHQWRCVEIDLLVIYSYIGMNISIFLEVPWIPDSILGFEFIRIFSVFDYIGVEINWYFSVAFLLFHPFQGFISTLKWRIFIWVILVQSVE